MSLDQKRDAIIEAALKRFAHFGVAKTTMNEIAKDLKISKASLYYYFPDKINLYAEVLKTIINISETRGYSATFENEADPKKSILAYLATRTDFIIKYYNIIEYIKMIYTRVPKELQPVFSEAKRRELKTIEAIIEKGRVSNHLKVENPKGTSELFLDCLEGLRYTTFSSKPDFFPDKKQFQNLLKREKEFALIFFNGLS